MKFRQTVRSTFSTIIFLAVVFLTSTTGQAADFYAVIANLNNSSDPHAQIDVSVDTLAEPGGAPSPVWFNVFKADGSQLAEFQVLTNANGFASSGSAPPPYDNLFTVSEGQPALVKVTTVSTGGLGGAVLRQTLGKSETLLGLSHARRADGTRFAEGQLFPTAIGTVGGGAKLLIANVSHIDVAVDVFLGRNGPAGGGKYAIPRLVNNAIWIVDIDPADANSNFVVSSTAEIIVQSAVSDAKKGISEWPVLPVY